MLGYRLHISEVNYLEVCVKDVDPGSQLCLAAFESLLAITTSWEPLARLADSPSGYTLNICEELF